MGEGIMLFPVLRTPVSYSNSIPRIYLRGGAFPIQSPSQAWSAWRITPNMANIPTPIPHLNLKDGTSIPMLAYGSKSFSAVSVHDPFF